MSAVPQQSKLGGVARTLVQEKLLNAHEAETLEAQAKGMDVPFISHVIQSKKLTALRIAEVMAQAFGMPLFDLEAMDPNALPAKSLDGNLMHSKRVLALQNRGNTLFIGLSDPSNLHALDEVQLQARMTFSPVIVEDDKLSRWIEKIAVITTTAEPDLPTSPDINLDSLNVEEEKASAPILGMTEIDESPIVKFLQKMLLDAIQMGASDLHFEPYEKFYRVRFRVDGVLREITRPPLAIREKLASRIKIISGLDITEKRVPQDGKIKMVLSKTRSIDLRVSTLPLVNGEKIVMRILDPAIATLGIEALGYEPDQKEKLLHAINRPYGMVLVTGPTGSGKTVSLYTCLNILNDTSVNISTAEDPAEISLPGINQVSVNDKAGLTFASALRAFLRQDPDVIMVGEIRDLETADIAIKAAQTGHMVLSTLHTNDAPSTLTRLMNMGVPPFNIASSVNLITAQRLARRLCKHCKQPTDLPKEALMAAGFGEQELDGSWQLYAPKEGGCNQCNRGYKGRVGIYQVMPITEEMSRIIMSSGTAHDIADQAKREGVVNLRHAGLLKVKQGLTSLAEIDAVTNE